MNASLRPATAQALQAFRARRQRLLLFRAFLVILLVTLSAWTAIALLDRAWLMPEWLRPWLSLLAYGGALLVAWQVALRHLLLGQDAAGTARLMESVSPGLHERLLSAVELSEGRGSDSQEFRTRLQDEVAAEVESLDLAAILPLRSLKPWFAGLGAALLVLLALSCFSFLHLPGFIARAAIPFANLSRPSSVKISILEPRPADALVPFASELEIVAGITGPQPGEVILETESAGSLPRRTELVRSHDTRHSGLIAIGQGDVRYRVLAGDAISPWFSLSARARPRITSFVKTLVPPPYTGLPETTVTDEEGDIVALEGSVVKMKLTPNQKVSNAGLLINPDHADHPEIIPLKLEEDGTLTGELPIQAGHESWRSALTAAETGFTNEESSPWQISVIPDLPPLAQILEPQEQLSQMADEVVRVKGLASDDVGLKSVHLAHAINGTDWQQIALPLQPGKESQVQAALPLAPLQVKPGDAVLIKLVATDLKGQTAESPTVRIIILEQTVDPQHRQWAQDMRRLAQQATHLSEQTREMRKVMEKVKKAPKKAANEPPESTLARAQTELQQVSERAEDLWTQLKQAAQSAPSHLDSMEVQLLGEKLAHMRNEPLAQMKKLATQDIENPDSLRRAASEAGADADAIAQAARAFATEDNAKIVSQAAQQLSRQEALLTTQSLNANRDSAQRPKWQEQQRAAIAASEALRQEMETLKPVLDAGQQKQVEEMRKNLAETASDLEASLDKPGQTKSPEHLYGAADNHRQRLGRSADAMRAISENAGAKASQLREQLARQENPAIVALNEARDALAQAAAEAKNTKRKPKVGKDNETAPQRAEKELAQATKQLEDQAVLREQNGRTNNQAALDANRASRAAGQLAREVAALPEEATAIAAVQQKAEQLTQLTRMLEADALTQTAVEAIAEAAANPDPAQSANPTQATEQARAASEALRQLPEMLKRLKTPDPQLATSAQQAADTSRQASEELQALARQSAQQPDQPLNTQRAQEVAADAEQKASQVAQQIAAQTTSARETLAGLTPDVSDMMKAVAQDLKQTQQATQAAAAQAEASQPVAEVAEKAQDLQAEATENAQQMESLQAALRQEANAADLQEAAQRQTARMADVALAQMQQKSPQIAQNLKQAAQAQQSQPQAQNLQQAAQAQKQTAEALDQLAQNMAKAEDGQALTPEELAAMQNMEEELGVQESLEEAYKRAQELAEMAKDASQDPAAVLAELEKELPKNPAMKKSLAELSKQAAQSSEQAVAQEASQPSNIGLATEQAAHDLARVARHQQRLGQEAAAQQAAQASNQLQQQAQAAKGQPGQTQKPIGSEAQTTAAQAAKAAEASASATPPSVSVNPFQDIQGALLAQALDQLDQTLNPKQGQSGDQQQSQSGQQQQPGGDQQQKAQQSLSQAQQSQQQSMANQRNQGQTPGSQKPGQQQAQNQNKPNPNDPTQPSNSDMGNQSLQIVEGVLGPDAILIQGDWGHLPSKMAADLSEATRTEAAPEYRSAIESYYKAIATKAKR
ncbi:uncharacterized protein DUF4175 [Prosthecobacter fusiformis]|uniref:Uncharacterized protein DUF4175 n=1 Tax=Prosthecobacter fusiformis TaxID=48464 RepID=A0A4R7SR18_9BACT|nr:DUF4175 family protein [Prosthecobacter fusiformis]TDU81374.1 uncharacterized protein DUF4175 [Prosthecobacter fusiformis]